MKPDVLTSLAASLAAIDAEGTAPGIVGALADVLRDFGFRHLLITGLPSLDGEPWQNAILYDGWPSEWFDRYVACGHFSHDPCANHTRRTSDPFLWNQLSTARMSDRQARVMEEAAEFGMLDGLCVPIHRPFKAPAVVTAAGRDITVGQDDLPMLEMICIHAFRSLQPLQKTSEKSHRHHITDREREILRWISEGKTAEDVACILALSKLTVDCHLRNIREKLDATNTLHAVVRAVEWGYIHP